MTTNAVLSSTVTRLVEQFPDVPVGTIEATVEECQQHLSELPPGPLPELVERLALWRLSEIASE